jgi:Domain of unknown function (DUF4430)
LAVSIAPLSASAANVQIRVEGKTRTIFGAVQPRLDAANPLEALERASVAGEFYYHLATTSFGTYVDQIARYPAGATSGWVFKVNGVSPPVGADKVALNDGDAVLWYWADFAAGTGPRTLELVRGSDGCYLVRLQDDTGARTAARGATLHVDGRRVVSRTGRTCLGKHRGLVRATLTGAVRSNAVR